MTEKQNTLGCVYKIKSGRRVKDDIDQTRITIKELGNGKQWLNWIGGYGEELELKNDLPKEGKKEYLEGLVEKIIVRLDK